MNNLQVIAYEWGMATFGAAHMMNKPVRASRMAEEAIETAQTMGVPKEQMLKLVEAVYSRPPGELTEELGGTALTLAVLCSTCGFNLETIMRNEIIRVVAKKKPDEMRKRNEEKIAQGFTG